MPPPGNQNLRFALAIANPLQGMDYGRCSSETRNIFNTSIVAKRAFSIQGIGGYLLNNGN